MRRAEPQSTVQALSPLAKLLVLVPVVTVWSKLTVQPQEHIFHTQMLCNHFLSLKSPLQGDPVSQELFIVLKMLLREMQQPAILLNVLSIHHLPQKFLFMLQHTQHAEFLIRNNLDL